MPFATPGALYIILQDISDRPIYRPADFIGRYLLFFLCIGISRFFLDDLFYLFFKIFFPGMIYRHFNKCSFFKLRLEIFVIIIVSFYDGN